MVKDDNSMPWGVNFNILSEPDCIGKWTNGISFFEFL
jgi:hypothetical protein